MALDPLNIGRYRILRPLGQGAMGVVYLAEDPLLKRNLAIKVVKAVGEARDLALERFQREAEISAKLNHPNVVTIYDVGEEPGMGPFLAMEYVEGSSLARLIRDRSLGVEASFNILIQAMRALRAAHRCAIVHRDVKPENILVGEEGRVKLMDFGIARTMSSTLTGSGEFLGSPAYSAPELLRGNEPTPASDRYAFAASAFELLTGRLPHPGPNVAAVITHVLHEPPAIPPDMNVELAALFRRGLAPDPEDRPQTLVEFVGSLISVYPMSPHVRERIQEQMRQDTQTQDILPQLARPVPSRPATTTDPGGRASPAYLTEKMETLGGLAQTGALRIQLDHARSSQPDPPLTRPVPSRPPDATATVSLGRMVKWVVVVVVISQLIWWILVYLVNRNASLVP
ncbi:MAG: serine/threonine protein kinase [Acidobacteria bacterium]|nr:serine/threonine protein kinase [Acidobacteriota bacterium]